MPPSFILSLLLLLQLLPSALPLCHAAIIRPTAFAPAVKTAASATSAPQRQQIAATRIAARHAAPRMGVPKFFRWLTERFPQINRRISEGRRSDEYVDNFYLDMNGIIHTCTHGEGVKPGEALDEELTTKRIFDYTERLIRIAKPRKVCYLAIDGVAPRAKMNQQRSRRYRAPKEAAQLLEQQMRQGVPPPTEPPFDSNCITPGTEFLASLGEKYKEWIAHKLATDPDWQNGPTIIFSGAEVIGEGEHKIMDFIRRGRGSGEFDDETRHCMYGLDADLIMLGLVTHAPKFCLLRERQRFQKGRLAPRKRGGGRGSEELKPTGITDKADLSRNEEDNRDFIFLEVEMLRTLLAGTLRPRAATFTALPDANARAGASEGAAATAAADAADAANEALFDDERLVDDFVFMCMLVGNDFLPHSPHLR